MSQTYGRRGEVEETKGEGGRVRIRRERRQNDYVLS